MHLIATYFPVFSDRAVKTTENVPLPFSYYSLYWSIVFINKNIIATELIYLFHYNTHLYHFSEPPYPHIPCRLISIFQLIEIAS